MQKEWTMKRTWMVLTVLLATVGGPATAAMARPISTYSTEVIFDSGGWNGSVMLETDEQGLGYLYVYMSKKTVVQCAWGQSMDSLTVAYNEATAGAVNVERKLASLTFESAQSVTSTYFDGCNLVETVSKAPMSLSVGAVATGDLNRGRNAQGRVLSRMSDVTVSLGGMVFTDSAALQELITKG